MPNIIIDLCTIYGTLDYENSNSKFYRSDSGKEPVKEWLKSLCREDMRIIGEDIKTVEFGWPLERRDRVLQGLEVVMDKHIGSSFDDFLEEENLLIESSAEALKRVLAWQVSHYLEENNITKTNFARIMKTSRSQLDRLLDPDNTNISLKTLVGTAKAMGKHVEILLTHFHFLFFFR